MLKSNKTKKKVKDQRDHWITKVQDKTYKVQNTTKDGYQQFGHIYLQEDQKTDTSWIIILHGYFSGEGESQAHASHFYQLGYNILTNSLRARGKSQGIYTTMADKEAGDLIEWTKLITNQYQKAPITYHGTSMGGATVINAAGRGDLPSNVIAIIDDCGYSDTWGLAMEIKNRYGLPAKPFSDVLNSVAKIQAKTDFSTNKPIKSAQNINRPVLYIHSEQDDFVPISMGVDLYNNTQSPKKFIKSKNAAHAESHYDLGEEYYKLIDEFMKKIYMTIKAG